MKIRVGFGFDVHRLVEGRELWLGGIRIEHSCGLLGHSDADVLIMPYAMLCWGQPICGTSAFIFRIRQESIKI